MEEANMEERMVALQNELERIMEELEHTRQDRDEEVALGMDMETRLQTTQAELNFVNKQLAALQKQYQEVTGQAGYYKAERDAFKLERDTLRSQMPTPGSLTPMSALMHASTSQESSQPALTIPRTSSPKLAKLPDPPVFTGDSQMGENSLDIWKIKIADKIEQDAARYPDALAQLRYVFSRVGGAAQAQLESYAEENYARALARANEHPGTPAYKTMLTILDNAFGDPDRANTARTKLAKLNQGKKSFAEHYAEFMRYASKTGYDESSLLHMLRLQLSQELGTALSYQATEPKTMDELVRLCQSLDNRQRAEQYRQRTRMAPQQTRTVNMIGTTPCMVSSRPASPPTASTATGTHPGPMDMSAGKTRAKWVTPEVLAERRAKGLCVRCGSKQHFVSQCMLLPTRRPQVMVAEAQIPENAEVDTTESESKNM